MYDIRVFCTFFDAWIAKAINVFMKKTGQKAHEKYIPIGKRGLHSVRERMLELNILSISMYSMDVN